MTIIEAIKKIAEKEKEINFLIEHESWGAAEGVNNQICHFIKQISDVQPEKLDYAIALNGLRQLATGGRMSVLPALESLV